MKTNLIVFASLFLLIGFGFSSCDKHDHDEEIEVKITIESPADNAVITDASAVNISVFFETEDDLHDVKVYLKNETDNSNVAPFPIDGHEHAKSYRIQETVNLSSYPAGTEFHLEAEACKDHDCDHKEKKSIHFKLAN